MISWYIADYEVVEKSKHSTIVVVADDNVIVIVIEPEIEYVLYVQILTESFSHTQICFVVIEKRKKKETVREE